MSKKQVIAIAILQFCAWSIPANAQEYDIASNPQCQAIVSKHQNKLMANRALSVRARASDTSRYSDDFPTDRPIRVQFILDGAATDSVMNSPQMQKAISKDIIQKCESVGTVSFGVNQSGWHTTFGLFDRNRIEEFKCYEFTNGERPGRMPYGYMNCGV